MALPAVPFLDFGFGACNAAFPVLILIQGGAGVPGSVPWAPSGHKFAPNPVLRSVECFQSPALGSRKPS